MEHILRKSSLTKNKIIVFLGIAKSKYYSWRKRIGIPNRHNGLIPKRLWIREEEKHAVIKYCKDKILLGYRRLTYMMIDEDVAFLSPATVYRVLKSTNLLNKWSIKGKSIKGCGFIQPLKPHEHWHIDIAYVNILGTFFFLICILDGFSRMILYHEIRSNMQEYDVEIVLRRAKEKYPYANGRLISDNGPQFISKNFKEFIRESGLAHIKTSVGYPQSNGKLERFHGTIKQEKIRVSSFIDIKDAERQIKEYIEFYNNKRLHSGIYYLTPEEVFEGKMRERLEERNKKLDKARKLRIELAVCR